MNLQCTPSGSCGVVTNNTKISKGYTLEKEFVVENYVECMDTCGTYQDAACNGWYMDTDKNCYLMDTAGELDGKSGYISGYDVVNTYNTYGSRQEACKNSKSDNYKTISDVASWTDCRNSCLA